MFENLNEVLEHAFKELYFPFAVKMLPDSWTGYDVHKKHCKEVKEFISEAIQEHKRTRVQGQISRVR